MSTYDAGTVKATMKADGSGLHSTVEVAKKDIGSIGGSAKEAQAGLKELGVSAGVAFGALTAGIFKAVQANNQLKASMQGLDSVATGNIGSYDKIKKELQKIQADGLIPLTNATQAYKNLISRYQDEETAIKMFNKIADAAAFGRQAHLSLGDAIQGTSEGLKNEMSNMTDNGGITKNLSVMWKEYAATIGKTVGKLTEAEKRQAEVNGFMTEGRFQTGDLAKLQQQLGGQMAKTTAETNLTAAAFGDALEPAVGAANLGFQAILKSVRNMIQASPELASGVTAGTLALTGLTAAGAAWNLVWPKVKAGFTFMKGGAGIALIAISALTSVVVGLVTAAKNAKKEVAQAAEELVNQSKKLGESTYNLNELIKKYESLKNKANLSKKEQEKLQKVVKQIGTIAPQAVIQWNNLGEAMAISGTKAKQAVQDMLKARIAILEVAKARAQYEIPQAKRTIELYSEQNQAALDNLAGTQARQLEITKNFSKIKELYDKFKAGDITSKQAVSMGIEAGTMRSGVAEIFTIEKIYKSAKEQYDRANQELDKAIVEAKKYGEKVAAAQEVLAKNEANIAEYNAILAKSKKGIIEPPLPETELDDEDDEGGNKKNLNAQLKLQEQLLVEHLERLGELKQAEVEKENQRYKDELETAQDNKKLIEQVRQGHKERLEQIDKDFAKKEEDAQKEAREKYIKQVQDELDAKRQVQEQALSNLEAYTQHEIKMGHATSEDLISFYEKVLETQNLSGEEYVEYYRKLELLKQEVAEKDKATLEEQKTLMDDWQQKADDVSRTALERQLAQIERDRKAEKEAATDTITDQTELKQTLANIDEVYNAQRQQAISDDYLDRLGLEKDLTLEYRKELFRRLQDELIVLEADEEANKERINAIRNALIKLGEGIAADIKIENDDYAQALYDETHDALSSAIQDGFEDGSKSAVDSFVDYLKQKLRKNIADALADAIMGSSFGQGLQSGMNSISGVIGSLFGKSNNINNTGANTTSTNTGSGTEGTETALSKYFQEHPTLSKMASFAGNTAIGSAAGGGDTGATLGAAIGSIWGPLGSMAGGLLGGLFDSGSNATVDISANTAKMDIDFATANFKTVTLPKTYMSSQSGTTRNANSVAPVVNVNINAAGNIITERDLQKTMKDTANEVYSARKVAGEKWSEATVNGVDINDY